MEIIIKGVQLFYDRSETILCLHFLIYFSLYIRKIENCLDFIKENT